MAGAEFSVKHPLSDIAGQQLQATNKKAALRGLVV
jgi:hypothetical protein